MPHEDRQAALPDDLPRASTRQRPASQAQGQKESQVEAPNISPEKVREKIAMLRTLFAILLFVVPVAAQEAPQPEMKKSSSPLEQYPKSKAVAVGLEVVIPILGHGYAGNAKKGILPALTTFGGYVAIATTLNDEGEIKEDKEGVAAAGAALAVAGRVWALMQVSRMVDAHNRGLSLEPLKADRLGAKLVFKF